MEKNADVVIHCGDLGFLSERHIQGIPDRQLSLLIRHSHLKTERNRVWDLDYEEKVRIVMEHHLLGEFDAYLNGDFTFEVPVYAVPGNHDDNRVVHDLLSGKRLVPNLHIITPDSNIVLDNWIRLTGVGGNMSIHSFISKRKKQSFHTKVTFDHWVAIYQNLEKWKSEEECVWFVTHVSPGKQPILELLSIHLRPDLWFSGHMGVPMPQHYSLKTVYETRDFVKRITPSIDFIQSKWHELTQKSAQDNKRLDNLKEYLWLLALPKEMETGSQEEFPLREPRQLDKWMRGTFFFNLPDANKSVQIRPDEQSNDITLHDWPYHYRGAYIVIDTVKKTKDWVFKIVGSIFARK